MTATLNTVTAPFTTLTTTVARRLRDAFRRGPSMPRPRLYGSTDIEDRDLARVLADLRVSPGRRTPATPATRGPEG